MLGYYPSRTLAHLIAILAPRERQIFGITSRLNTKRWRRIQKSRRKTQKTHQKSNIHIPSHIQEESSIHSHLHIQEETSTHIPSYIREETSTQTPSHIQEETSIHMRCQRSPRELHRTPLRNPEAVMSTLAQTLPGTPRAGDGRKGRGQIAPGEGRSLRTWALLSHRETLDPGLQDLDLPAVPPGVWHPHLLVATLPDQPGTGSSCPDSLNLHPEGVPGTTHIPIMLTWEGTSLPCREIQRQSPGGKEEMS